jgi:hypothetical protein
MAAHKQPPFLSNIPPEYIPQLSNAVSCAAQASSVLQQVLPHLIDLLMRQPKYGKLLALFQLPQQRLASC